MIRGVNEFSDRAADILERGESSMDLALLVALAQEIVRLTQKEGS